MKLRFLLLAIICSFHLNAQTSGHVTYKSEIVSQMIDTAKIKNDNVKQMMLQTVQKMKRQMPFITYELKFTKDKSVFNRKKMMSVDNIIDYEDIAGFSDANGEFFTSVNKGMRLRSFKSRSKEYIIKSNLPEWDIINEKKDVLGYNCMKAITKKQLDNGNYINVVAWFSKDLLYNFGPKEFIGLPGLVLEVEERGMKFYATNIRLNNKNYKIKLPDVSKSISRKEYLSQSFYR
ncbi:GLPGLI family protein [Psychroflexus tropicus]|uniref:GLPGLI family protein n=1 Tax=Psychroflexus tropicus TaxID=197345 RepID=UPI000360BAF4|nr:GLPGLI family protein [Psychroflexus tropicus]